MIMSRHTKTPLLWLLLVMLLTLPLSAGPHPLPQKSPAVPGSFADATGVCIIDLATGSIITDINKDRQFIPASVTKALTSATVLCLNDSTERFITPVAAIGPIKNGTLDGNILINCVGDPTINSRHLKEACGFADSVASALCALGIKRITGRVIVDEAEMGPCDIPPGWMSADLTQKYGAQLFGANYADNLVTLALPSGTTTPATPRLEIERTGGKGALRLSRDRNSRKLILAGSGKGHSALIANPMPCSTMEAAVTEAIKHRGIEVEGNSVNAGNETVTPVYTHRSPRYVDIMRSLMVRSDNLYAEGMLRTLAPGESRQEALAEEFDIWTDNEVDLHGILIEDGSGLSRNNRMTPLFLARVLEWMSQSLVAPSYVRLFPKVGSEGTVRNFMKGTPLEGQLVLKTGSMNGVQSYAGYKLDEYGTPTHAVVVMSNNFKCSRPALKATIADMLLQVFAPEEPEYTEEDIIEEAE